VKYMSDVYHTEDEKKFLEKLKQELKEKFAGCNKIALKIHFGEPENKTTFVPEDIKPITDTLKEIGLDYFLFDSPVKYNSPRNTVEEYKKSAKEQGWEEIGEVRISNEFIEAEGKYIKKHQVCKELADADGVLVVSHFKGHLCSGFGGAVKNLGMGALTRESKEKIHEGGKPLMVGECTACGLCADACPFDAIEIKEKAEITGYCGGCSLCAIKCPNDVFKPKIATFDILLGEGAALAQSKFKKYYYVSILKKITKGCDCGSSGMGIIAKDDGFVMSCDGVSIDMASHDIIKKNEGKDVFLESNHKTGKEHVEAAAEFGMGEKGYNLIEI
jgi:hypothetical protein